MSIKYDHFFSAGSEHGLSVECDSLIRDVVVETGLFKNVGTTVSDFSLLRQSWLPFFHFIFLQLDISQEQPGVQAGLIWLSFLDHCRKKCISVTCILLHADAAASACVTIATQTQRNPSFFKNVNLFVSRCNLSVIAVGECDIINL